MTATLTLRETGRHITRGLHKAQRGGLLLLDREEKKTVTVDFSNVLGDATISSVRYDTYGLSVSSTSNTTTAATLQLSGQSNGYVDVEATDSTGDVHMGRLIVNASHAICDYGRAH